jgi:hypothetical protein
VATTPRDARRRRAAAPPGFAALGVGVLIVIVAGGLASAALGEFPGATWFVVRLLITVVFLMGWWTVVGRDVAASVVGGVMLALVWATYGQFLGPVGLPDTPLRIFTAAPPPVQVHWLGYTQLWGISFPLYLVTMVGILVVTSRPVLAGRFAWRRPLAAGVALIGLLLLTGASITGQSAGETARISASGTAQFEIGAFYGNRFSPASGRISITATDQGGRVSPLPPHDGLTITATVTAAGHVYDVTATKPIVDDPLGRFTTWWGVGLLVWHHGQSGIGTARIPEMESDLAVFGVGDVSKDDASLASGVPVHVMTAEPGDLAGGERLELDVGDPQIGPIAGLPGDHPRVLWNSYSGSVPSDFNVTRYVWGSLALVALIGAALWLAPSPGRHRVMPDTKAEEAQPTDSPMLVDQQASHVLGSSGCFGVPLGGSHDGALYQDVPGKGEGSGIAQARLLRQTTDHSSHVLQVTDASPARGVLGPHLEQHSHERAAFEVGIVEPLIEQIEDGEQALLWGGSASFGLLLDPLSRPPLLPPLEEGDDDVVLGGKVAVEGGLRHTCPFDQLIDTDGTDPSMGKELVRGVDDAFPGRTGGLPPPILLGHSPSIARVTDRSVYERRRQVDRAARSSPNRGCRFLFEPGGRLFASSKTICRSGSGLDCPPLIARHCRPSAGFRPVRISSRSGEHRSRPSLSPQSPRSPS